MEQQQDSSGSEDRCSMLNDKLFVVLRRTKHEETIIIDLKICLLKGANVNSQNQRGNTILHLAVKKRYQKVVRYLLSVQGIRKDIMNLKGFTVVDLAEPDSLVHSSGNKSSPPIHNIDAKLNMAQNDQGINVDQDFHQPLSTNLTVDKDLFISNESFKNLLISCSNNSRSRAETLELEPFPAPKIMALFALLVYCGKGRESDEKYERSLQLPKGWFLLTTASNPSTGNGYFGAAFLNPSNQQVVLAHRGSVLTESGSWWTNLMGIIWNKNAPRMNSAATFTAIIYKALSEANAANHRQFQLSLTGHSMGGWLAQVSAFSAQHMQIKNEVFVKLKNDHEGFLAHTVVFDNPGCKKKITKLRESVNFRYDRSIALDRLDITCYLSAPNMINGCNLHLGAIYRVITDLDDMGYCQRKTLLYNLATHSMQKMLKALEGTPTIVQVLDWPLMGAEQNKFFKKANHRNNYHPQSKEGEQYAQQYDTRPLDSKACSLRIFSQEEQSLLETWSVLRKFSLVPNHLVDLAAAFGFNHCDGLLPMFKIDKEKQTLSCNDKASLDNVIRHTKQLIRWFHGEVSKATMAQVNDVPKAVQSIFQGESQNYVISLPESQMHFKDSLGLERFLDSSSERILFIHTDDTEFQATKLYNVFKQVKKGWNKQTDQCFQMYLKDECQIFLEWRQLRRLAKLVHIENLLKSDTSFDNLLVIEYKSDDQSEISDSDRDFLNSVFVNLKQTDGKKIVLISSREINLPEGIATMKRPEDVSITDLTAEAQEALLSKETISLQGTKMSLAQLVGMKSLDASSVATFNRLIGSSKLKQLFTATSTVLDIGKELPTLSDLEVAYTTPVNKITSLQQLRMHFSNSNELVSRLPYFVISGVSEESRVSEPGWKELLEAGNNKVEIWFKEYSEHGEQKFKELVRQFPDRVVSWLHSTAGHLRWQKVYDLDFYIERQFIKRLIIDNAKIPQLAKNNNDLFVFQYSKDRESLMLSLNVKNEKDFFKNLKIISPDDQEDAIIKDNYGKNIHYFTVEEGVDVCLVWRRSAGSLDGLRPYMQCAKGVDVSEKQLCDGSSKLVILADEPGMGKSTSLTRVSGLINDSWVIRIDFKYFQIPISRLPYDVTIADAVGFLLTESSSGDSAERELLQYCLQTATARQVYVLFDGFDEIQEIHSGEILKKCAQEKVVRLLRFLKDNTTANILVTTRKYPSHVLENELSVFVTKFKKVEAEQQEKFVVKFWQCHLALEPGTGAGRDRTLKECASSWHRQAARILGEDIASFMGIPLQMRMIAEVSLAQARLCVESAVPIDVDLPFSNVFDLYEIFINAKYDIYLKDKSGFSAGLNSVNRQWFVRELTMKHRALAFRQLFPDLAAGYLGTEPTDEEILELNRVGLIQSSGDGTVEFTHRTFAEYFTAELLVHWLSKPRGRHPKYPPTEEILLFTVLLEADYKVCRQFFDDQLRKASPALWNNYSQVRRLWSQKKGRFFSPTYQTALHVSVQEKRESILSFLLSRFEKDTSLEDYTSFVTTHDLNGDNALSLAAKNESKASAERLLIQVDEGVQKNIILSTVFKSLKNKDDPFAHFLIEFTLETKGCWKLESSCMEKIWPLIKSIHTAAEEGNLKSLQEELAKAEGAADLRYLLAATNRKGATVLHIAAKTKQYEMVEYLLQNHADIDAIDCEAMTPLLHAAIAKTSNSEIVKFLISRGANIMHCDRYSMTALAWAAKSNQFDIVKYLFTLRAELLNISDINRITPLHHAAKSGHDKVVAFLLEKGADIDGQDKFGMSALSWAARGGHLLVIKLLLGKKADIDQKDRYGRSCLQIAIKASQWGVAKYLVANGAEINSADWTGVTALQRATKAGKWDLVKQLLDSNADVIATSSGICILSHAEEANKLDIAKKMVDRGAVKIQLEHTNKESEETK